MLVVLAEVRDGRWRRSQKMFDGEKVVGGRSFCIGPGR